MGKDDGAKYFFGAYSQFYMYYVIKCFLISTTFAVSTYTMAGYRLNFIKYQQLSSSNVFMLFLVTLECRDKPHEIMYSI